MEAQHVRRWEGSVGPIGIRDEALEWFAFVATAVDKQFRWGSCDCALFIADWCRHLTGRDPAKDLRGRYDDWRGAERFILEEGGLVAVIEKRLRWPERVGEPEVGDVAVVMLPAGETAAVRGPNAWWGRSLIGVGDIAEDVRVVKVWACPR